MNKPAALVGMSGGVDSSAAALLMQEAGYSCIGVTMKLWSSGETDAAGTRVCCTLDDAEDARAVACKLGIPHYVFNFSQDFRRNVVDRFAESYASGRTPNPCIDCNRYLKFGSLLHRALELGCTTIATGHYARCDYDAGSGRYLLRKAADTSKDQTYFLACLSQEQLARTRFPLGELTKKDVRALAEEHGLITARKRDSQDICFVPDGDYAAFLQRYTGRTWEPGDFLDLEGHVVGRHRGTVCYTIGQRKGLGLAMGSPVYVCSKDPLAGTVTVGPDAALYSAGLEAEDWNWFPFSAPDGPLEVTARIRHSRSECAATVVPTGEGRARVLFREPQRAVSPGQAVVLYQGDLVIGGGTITRPLAP